jgi:hypothetical protein
MVATYAATYGLNPHEITKRSDLFLSHLGGALIIPDQIKSAKMLFHWAFRAFILADANISPDISN